MDRSSVPFFDVAETASIHFNGPIPRNFVYRITRIPVDWQTKIGLRNLAF
jgi:hypothetical protein